MPTAETLTPHAPPSARAGGFAVLTPNFAGLVNWCLTSSVHLMYTVSIVRYTNRGNKMVTVAAEKSLKVLKSNLTLSAKGVKNVEMAVKSFRASIIDAANADFKFGGSKEYTQLEKQFSTFYLPKMTEMATYTAKALTILDKVMPAKAPVTVEDIEEWISGNDYY